MLLQNDFISSVMENEFTWPITTTLFASLTQVSTLLLHILLQNQKRISTQKYFLPKTFLEKALVCLKVKIMRFLNTNKTKNSHKQTLPKPKIKKKSEEKIIGATESTIIILY